MNKSVTTKGVEDGMEEHWCFEHCSICNVKPVEGESMINNEQLAEVKVKALAISCDRCGVAAGRACYWGDGLGAIADAFHLRRMVAANRLPIAHPEQPSMSTGDAKLEYQKADNSMHSTIPDASFGTHIKEAVAIVKDWAKPPLSPEMEPLFKKVIMATYEYWDSDQDSKVGKRLRALAGLLPGYDRDIDTLLDHIEGRGK